MPVLQEVETQAMHLEQPERALLAEHLIASLDTGKDEDAEALWIREAESRYASYKRGGISSSPADEVLEQAHSNLK
jgi:putative addiction module component (TIGR02574 family)